MSTVLLGLSLSAFIAAAGMVGQALSRRRPTTGTGLTPPRAPMRTERPSRKPTPTRHP